MRKLTMLFLVLVLILGLGGVAGATCNPQSPCLPKEAELKIAATNPLQGVIEGLARSWKPLFPCGDNKQVENSFDFKIRSNGYLKVSMDLTELKQQGQAALPTLAVLNQKGTRGGSTTYTERIRTYYKWGSLPDKFSNSYTMNAQNAGNPANGVREYRLDVTGKVGKIEDHLHGVYNGKVKITISVP